MSDLGGIRARNEARKATEATGIIGGVRQEFDIDYLLRYIDRMGVQLGQAQDEVFELQEWQNTVANRMPDHYEDDIAQEAIIDRWLDDLTKGTIHYACQECGESMTVVNGRVDR